MVSPLLALQVVSKIISIPGPKERRTIDGWTRQDINVLLPQLIANIEVTITGEKPISMEKQSAISSKVALMWFQFVAEHRAEWESIGLTWESNLLAIKHFHKHHF